MLELTHDDTVPVLPDPGRYDDAITAVFMLRGAIKLWEAEGQTATHNLYQYLQGGEPCTRNPLGNLRQYRQFQAVVDDAAGLLMVGSP